MKTNTWVNDRREPIAVKARARFLYFNLTNVAFASDLADEAIQKSGRAQYCGEAANGLTVIVKQSTSEKSRLQPHLPGRQDDTPSLGTGQ